MNQTIQPINNPAALLLINKIDELLPNTEHLEGTLEFLDEYEYATEFHDEPITLGEWAAGIFFELIQARNNAYKMIKEQPCKA
jgi:hypothetical protein